MSITVFVIRRKLCAYHLVLIQCLIASLLVVRMVKVDAFVKLDMWETLPPDCVYWQLIVDFVMRKYKYYSLWWLCYSHKIYFYRWFDEVVMIDEKNAGRFNCMCQPRCQQDNVLPVNANSYPTKVSDFFSKFGFWRCWRI